MTISTRFQFMNLPTNVTSMNDKLLFWELRKNRFDNCRIDVVHDLLNKRGNVEQKAGSGDKILSLLPEN